MEGCGVHRPPKVPLARCLPSSSPPFARTRGRTARRHGPALLAALGLRLALAPALARAVDLRQRLLAREPAVDLDHLALRLLVHAEEVRDLVAQLDRDVVEGLVAVPVRVLAGHAEDLVVLALVIAHAEQRDRLGLDHTA